METTEKIVEAYVRYVRGWATIPNIKCAGQFEIDLIAIDPVSLARYHIESGVSISGPFSKLTLREFSPEKLKIRIQQPSQRRTLGYFLERKFSSLGIVQSLKQYGFETGNYAKVIVSWGWEEAVSQAASAAGVILWDFGQLIREIVDTTRNRKTYFTDDTMRTIHLLNAAGVK